MKFTVHCDCERVNLHFRFKRPIRYCPPIVTETEWMQQLAIACCQHPAVLSFVMWWGPSVIDCYDLHPEREDYLLVSVIASYTLRFMVHLLYNAQDLIYDNRDSRKFLAIGKEKSTQNDIRSGSSRLIMKTKTVVHKVEVQWAKVHGMVDQLIQLCENASHPDDSRKLLEEGSLSGIHTHKGFRVPAEQRELRSDSCSARSKDLNLRSSSKPEVNGKLLELRMPAFSSRGLKFTTFWDRFQAGVHRQKDLDDSLKFVNLLSSLSGESDEKNHAEFWRELSTRRRVVEDTFWTYGCRSSETRESTLGREMTVSEAFLQLLAERFPEILALRATSMCSQGQALRTTCGRRIVKPYEMRQKEAGPGAKSCTEPTREAKRTAKVSITVRHLSIISSCPFCKDAHDAANCTELQKTDVQTPSMAVKKWPPGESLQGELKMFNVWMSESSSWASAPAAVAVSGHNVHPRAFRKDGQCMVVYCLLDPGSQSSFIQKDVADALGRLAPHYVDHGVPPTFLRSSGEDEHEKCPVTS
ncbi:hypothetical protein T01_12177 [Trichinella spiralis]|uniref:Uncharacterized protein n=1 Tax=Trichinella spiralis TaxID=6334 RepID=A0A0V1B8C4_TRISP|nr:hypothetical protein T01_12177 [Trichinella spiralis]